MFRMLYTREHCAAAVSVHMPAAVGLVWGVVWPQVQTSRREGRNSE